MSLSDGIAYASGLIALCALIVSLWTQRQVPALVARQIAQLDREGLNTVRAEIRAQLVETPEQHPTAALRHIRLTNIGAAAAKNVNLTFPDGRSPLDDQEAPRVLPAKVMQPQSSIDLMAWQFDMEPPYHAIITWEDGTGKQEREQTLA